jgi:hypothetical protein
MIYKLLAYADDVNLLGNSIETTKEKVGPLSDASMEVGLEINTGTTKYMLLFHHQNAGQNEEIKIATRLFENIGSANISK